jgi:tetratricopeptide (TPR) repeat protein
MRRVPIILFSVAAMVAAAVSCAPKMQQHMDWAGSYFNNKEYEKAAQEYQKAIDLGPTDPNTLKTAWEFMAFSYYDMGSYDRAAPAFEKALFLDTANVLIMEDLGMSYYHLNRLDDALNVLNKAAAVDANYSAVIYDDLGLVYTAKGDNQAAIDSYAKAIKIFSGDYTAYSRRADIYIAMGKNDLALSDLRQIIVIDEGNAMLQSAKDRIGQIETTTAAP